MEGEVIQEIEKDKTGGFLVPKTEACQHCHCQMRAENRNNSGKAHVATIRKCCKCGHEEER